ncbi:MAG TPA: HNH endonuclease signature motif containing protein [Kofleriaceae bacterium]
MKVSKESREAVERRARGACEYRRLPREASILPHQVDHIIGRQHQGSDDLDNLCLCCIRCNLKKGPNISSMDPASGLIVPLFHPRRHSWSEHFAMAQDGRLQGLTPEGRVTVQLMEMNDPSRLSLRALLWRQGRLLTS